MGALNIAGLTSVAADLGITCSATSESAGSGYNYPIVHSGTGFCQAYDADSYLTDSSHRFCEYSANKANGGVCGAGDIGSWNPPGYQKVCACHVTTTTSTTTTTTTT